MYSITEFKRKVLVLSVKVLLPYIVINGLTSAFVAWNYNMNRKLDVGGLLLTNLKYFEVMLNISFFVGVRKWIILIG